MTELEAIRERHSVRRYLDRPLEKEKVIRLLDKIDALNKRSGLHLQLVVNEPKAFKGSLLAYGKFSGVTNYIMVIGKDSDKMGYAAGYYGEKLVIYAQQIGLRTCWVGLTYKKIPGAFTVREGEKIFCCIAIGYGENDGMPHKSKSPDQVSNINSDSPDWFTKGVDAALLAPTAVNQQKFYFEYIAPKGTGEKGKVKPEKKFSMVGYSKIDLGIAMCNFEIGAGKENFDWFDSPF